MWSVDAARAAPEGEGNGRRPIYRLVEAIVSSGVEEAVSENSKEGFEFETKRDQMRSIPRGGFDGRGDQKRSVGKKKKKKAIRSSKPERNG